MTKTLTWNSECPTHRTHKLRYCVDAGYVPGKKYGSLEGLQAIRIERLKAAHVEPPAATVDPIEPVQPA